VSKVLMACAAVVMVLTVMPVTAQPPPVEMPPMEEMMMPGTGGDAVSGVALSPDGSLVAAAAGSVTVYRTDTGEQVAALTGHDGMATDVDFNAAGTLLATAGEDGTVRPRRPVVASNR